MPYTAKRPCPEPGCGALTSGGRCNQHKRPIVEKAYDEQRGSSTARGYGRKWRRESAAFLAEHPLCMCDECDEGRIRVTAATVVDHRIPHRGDMRLFWDRRNWQSMSKACHDRKTATEDGGFGNRRRVESATGRGGSNP